jgi:hypothetical protein
VRAYAEGRGAKIDPGTDIVGRPHRAAAHPGVAVMRVNVRSHHAAEREAAAREDAGRVVIVVKACPATRSTTIWAVSPRIWIGKLLSSSVNDINNVHENERSPEDHLHRRQHQRRSDRPSSRSLNFNLGDSVDGVDAGVAWRPPPSAMAVATVWR